MTRSVTMTTDTQAPQAKSREKRSATPRRKFLGLTASGAALAALLGQGATTQQAQASSGKLTIEVTGAQMDAIREPEGDAPRPTGPFYVEAQIYPEGTLDAEGNPPQDGSEIGTFRCWGWIFSADPFGASVSQEYEIDKLGAIYTHGREGTDKRSVTGGVDLFSGASGEATVEFINHENSSFRVTFALD